MPDSAKRRRLDINDVQAPADCIFCTRDEQPPSLFETASLYVMPDKFPLCPGHILIIPKTHLPCYAAASIELLDELDRTAARIRPFLTENYGGQVLTTETGVAGQTVFHAHLHLLPLPLSELPADVMSHPDVLSVKDWSTVQEYFAEHGRYFYIEFGGKRYLMPSRFSPVLQTLRRAVAEMTGLTLDEDGFEKSTTIEDVYAVSWRWQEWISHRGEESG